MGLITPDGQPAGAVPMGLQIAAPLNDVQLVALMAAKLVAEAGPQPLPECIEDAVDCALKVVALSVVRVQRGHLKQAVAEAEETLGRGPRPI